jgi:hypothetical protein
VRTVGGFEKKGSGDSLSPGGARSGSGTGNARKEIVGTSNSNAIEKDANTSGNGNVDQSDVDAKSEYRYIHGTCRFAHDSICPSLDHS